MDLITLALAKKFTKDTVNGLGAVKGSPATVKSYDYDDSGNTIVTFAWKDKDDVESTMDALIKKGVKGDSIDSVEVDEDGQIIVILDSGDNFEELELCKKLKSSVNFANSKIIVTTSVHNKTAVLDSGADLYLPKPYELTDLIRWVEYFYKNL